MEGLLFLIGVYVLDIVIKKYAAKKKEKQSEQHQNVPEDVPEDTQEDASQERPSRSLQDLIRQFENAQREATQGNIEPPMPPAEPQQHSGKVTLRDIALAVFEEDTIDIDFLMETFNFSEETAERVIADLQKYRIIGQDMGDGEYDVLVRDIQELENLLNHNQRAAEDNEAKLAKESEARRNMAAERERRDQEIRDAEMERQRRLNALETRAQEARALAGADLAEEASSESIEATATRHSTFARHISKQEVRRGFIWAKVIDEPRFKKRWTAKSR